MLKSLFFVFITYLKISPIGLWWIAQSFYIKWFQSSDYTYRWICANRFCIARVDSNGCAILSFTTHTPYNPVPCTSSANETTHTYDENARSERWFSGCASKHFTLSIPYCGYIAFESSSVNVEIQDYLFNKHFGLDIFNIFSEVFAHQTIVNYQIRNKY